MKELKDWVSESLLDDIEKTYSITPAEFGIIEEIQKFIDENYEYESIKISDKPNRKGKYEVFGKGEVSIKDRYIENLTNGLFVWTHIDGDFFCGRTYRLLSLEGAPTTVSGAFSCGDSNIKSLKGGPVKVGEFSCSFNDNMTNLVGAPKEVTGDFSCSFCKKLRTLKGVPEKVGGKFSISYNHALRNLDYLPKEIGGNFEFNRDFRQNVALRMSNEGIMSIYDLKSIVKGEIIL